MDSATFYADARKRLVAVTDDAAILAALDGMADAAATGKDELTDAALGTFLHEAARLNLSLDWIFCGAGEPFLAETFLARFLGSLVGLPKQDQRDVAHVLERMASASDTREGAVNRAQHGLPELPYMARAEEQNGRAASLPFRLDLALAFGRGLRYTAGRIQRINTPSPRSMSAGIIALIQADRFEYK